MITPQEFIMDIVHGVWKSQTLFSAVELGIFAALAEQPMTLDELSQKCGFSSEAGRKLLSTCTAMGLLEKEGEIYKNSSACEECLVPGKPAYLGNLVMHVYRDLNPLWNKLTDAVIENKNRWEQVTGSGESHFVTMYQDPVRLETFLSTIHLLSAGIALVIAECYDFSQSRQILDVGGATGVLGSILVDRYPHLQVTVLDLPPVCKITDQWIKEKYRLENKIKTHCGDFLRDPLPEGFDIIYLGWVLHDWPPEVQLKILEKCYQALPPGGTLLVSECLLNEEKSGPLDVCLLSLDMLISTDGGGESTGTEYMERLQKTGFKNVRIQNLPGPRDLIIGEKEATC